MTHHAYAEQHKPATPCTAPHLTFGGRCLNCGFDPCRDACPVDGNGGPHIQCHNCPKYKTAERRTA